MPLPVFSKTYEKVLNLSMGNTGNFTDDCRDGLFKMVNALLTFVNVPCTVWGSCDGAGGAGSFGNGDGVNRWTALSKLIWNYDASNHSWIVLNFPGIGPKAQMLISLGVHPSYAYRLVIGFTTTGYGAANGGADGSATAPPTSSNAYSVGEVAWGVSQAAWQGKVHLWHSTDGEVTRVFVHRGGSCTCSWTFDKPQNPHPGWTNPFLFVWLGTWDPANAGTFVSLAEQYNVGTRHGGANVSMCHAVECWENATKAPEYFSAPMDIPSAEFPITPSTGLWCVAATRKGKWGYMYDTFFGCVTGTAPGDSYPLDGTCQVYQVGGAGGLVMPGDGVGLALQVS